MLESQYSTHLPVQAFAATVDGNQLNAGLSGWRFLIGSRQRSLQTVAQCLVAFRNTWH